MDCELVWGVSRVWGIEGVYCGLEPFAMKLEFKMMRIRCF